MSGVINPPKPVNEKEIATHLSDGEEPLYVIQVLSNGEWLDWQTRRTLSAANKERDRLGRLGHTAQVQLAWSFIE
jgi:hypothetical protein